MNIEDLKSSLQEQFEDLKNQITESPAYNSAKEQFETLSPKAQKGIVFGGLTLVCALLIYIPMSYIWQSQDYVAEYEEKHQVIRELLKYGSVSSTKAPLPSETDSSSVIADIRSRLSRVSLTNEQIGLIEPAAKTASVLAKPPIVQTDITAQLKWLNLTQLVDIAHRLKNLRNNVKLTGLEINAAQEKDKINYFNVTYTLSSFSLPQSNNESSSKKKGRRR